LSFLESLLISIKSCSPITNSIMAEVAGAVSVENTKKALLIAHINT
jgi:hypothetical protein